MGACDSAPKVAPGLPDPPAFLAWMALSWSSCSSVRHLSHTSHSRSTYLHDRSRRVRLSVRLVMHGGGVLLTVVNCLCADVLKLAEIGSQT